MWGFFLFMRYIMNLDKASESIDLAIKADLPIFLVGSPGVGKSSIANRTAQKINYKLIDFRLSQCDITDLNGLPFIDNGKASFKPFDVFPIEGTPLPEGKDGWILFLDELNAAMPSVQVAAYKLILDRMVGNHKLHKNVRIICAGNKATDNAVVNDLSSALRSRLITIEVEADAKNWLKWAENNGIDNRITAYITEYPERLFQFNPETDDGSFPCPRTWEMLSKIIKQLPDLTGYSELVVGIIGNAAHDFMPYAKYSKAVPKFKDILDGTAKIDPKAPVGVVYMTIGSIISNIDENTPATDIECERITKCLHTYGSEYLTAFNSRLINVNKQQHLLKFPAYAKYVRSIIREVF